MKNKLWIVLLLAMMTVLAACGDDEEASDDLKMLKVDFPVPETAEVGETVELKAIVTYGDEKVEDADQMQFEYWKEGERDDSTYVDGDNNGDGTYTAEVSFDEDGTYQMYAHTTARETHTMPKKSIDVGDVSDDENDEDDDGDDAS